MNAPETHLAHPAAPVSGLSYKFQRLREEIRMAVASGELRGKLPGERTLAQRFGANAKTLSKALTDLAAEGLLDRQIGRGTFVKGELPRSSGLSRWLLLGDASESSGDLLEAFRAVNSDTETIRDVAGLRPSFLSRFDAVIDLLANTPESFLREMTIRNVPVVLINREPATLSTHAVLIDLPLAGARLAREMLLAGHHRFATVECRRSRALSNALRQVAARHEVDAIIETCGPDEVAALIDSPVTAILCDSAASAIAVRGAYERAGVEIPAQLSLTAVGCCAGEAPCSGYFLSPTELAEAAAGLLRDSRMTRPTVLWLTGAWRDAGTIRPAPAVPIPSQQVSSIRFGMVV